MVSRRYWIFGVFALWMIAVMQAGARPVVEVNLASATAWTFQPDGGKEKAKILSVPSGGWRLNGFPNATAGTYIRKVTIPHLPSGGSQVTLLEFEAVNWEATVFVGPDSAHLSEVGKHLSAWTPFRMDISRFVTPGQTTLIQVHVRDRNAFKDKEGRFTVPAATEWNDRQARGILRGVTLAVYPQTYISDVFVKPATASNSLTYEVTLVNASDAKQNVTLGGHLTPATTGSHWNYPEVRVQTMTLLPRETAKVSVGPLPWKAGRESWWWPNIPYRSDYRAQLHTLSLLLWLNPMAAAPLQTENVRFGFCSPGQTGNRYTLNGIPLSLRGDSLPEGTIGTDAFARLPGFLPPLKENPGWPGAIRNYQRLNFNVLRMHQVPCTRYMMDICDELGMLVIPETAIRGGGIQKENIDLLPDAYLTHLRELILRDRNHPSVFKWSLENELFGAPEPFMRKLYDTCQAVDGTRPCSIDDNVDYPSWPDFAIIEHYTQAAGSPDTTGGHPQTDRPFGQGEYAWPFGAKPQGPLWFALMTRALRIHENADIRPYTLIDVWPGVIPGLTPTNFPDPHLPPDSLEQGGRSLMDFPFPEAAWEDPRLKILQRSFAPLAIYDAEYDRANMHSNGRGEWPTSLPQLISGQKVIRTLDIFNDEFEGEKITLFLLPALRIKKVDGDVVKDEQEALPEIVREVTVSPGGHLRLTVELPLPKVEQNTALELTVTGWKNGKERYRETLPFVIVPEGKDGTTIQFEGRDEKTRGDWIDAQGQRHYGGQAFLVPVIGGRSGFQSDEVYIRRVLEIPAIAPKSGLVDEMAEQDGYLLLDKAATVMDGRILWNGPDRKARYPMAFQGKNGVMRLRVDTTDGQAHRLSLYLLDYRKKGMMLDVALYDTQGHRLDSRLIENLNEGVYVQYRFTGTVYIAISSLIREEPILSGIFVDPPS